MKELLIRTLSGAVLVALIVAGIIVSPWAWFALELLVVAMGVFEMSRLLHVEDLLETGEFVTILSFAIAAMVALGVLPDRWLFAELLLLMVPFLVALFSTKHDFRSVAAFLFGTIAFLAVPAALMVFMYQSRLFGPLAGPRLLLLVFAMLWVNDTFAYLTGRLLGRHKLFGRISPGKTVEGSIGGLLFTLGGLALLSHLTGWLSMPVIMGLGIVAVVFGTLGDLSESMLKRQAGVKDSGRCIPGHGGVLDRFDSVLFAVPFVFVYLLFV